MFESIMWKYMDEERKLLSDLIEKEEIKNKIRQIDGTRSIYFVAHGSSYNAAMSIAPFITRLTGIRTYVYTPSNFRYNAISIDEEDKAYTRVLGISQTGTSRGVLEALEDAKAKAEILAEAAGLHIIGIENIREGNSYSYDSGIANFSRQEVMDAKAVGGTVVQAAKISVTASVTVTFDVRD